MTRLIWKVWQSYEENLDTPVGDMKLSTCPQGFQIQSIIFLYLKLPQTGLEAHAHVCGLVSLQR